jgi:hypothetical protein
MPEATLTGFPAADLSSQNTAAEQNSRNQTSSAAKSFQTPRLETLSMPQNHEERLEWVRKSYERFFEKVREIDALMGIPELN